MQTRETPQASARSRPFSFRTSPERMPSSASGLCESLRNISSVSAICGTFSGWTKEPTCTTSTPEARRFPIHASFVAVGTICFST